MRREAFESSQPITLDCLYIRNATTSPVVRARNIAYTRFRLGPALPTRRIDMISRVSGRYSLVVCSTEALGGSANAQRLPYLFALLRRPQKHHHCYPLHAAAADRFTSLPALQSDFVVRVTSMRAISACWDRASGKKLLSLPADANDIRCIHSASHHCACLVQEFTALAIAKLATDVGWYDYRKLHVRPRHSKTRG